MAPQWPRWPRVMSSDAPGVAPAAGILSIRVTDANAQSDVFTLSQAIVAAVDAGAQIINISLGGYDPSDVLTAPSTMRAAMAWSSWLRPAMTRRRN